jgi:hypothetical protein
LLLQGWPAKVMPLTGTSWHETQQVQEMVGRVWCHDRPACVMLYCSFCRNLQLTMTLLGAGVLLVELVREFLQWCDLQFTQKVCTSLHPLGLLNFG